MRVQNYKKKINTMGKILLKFFSLKFGVWSLVA